MMYGRINKVVRDRKDLPVYPPRLLVGLAADEDDQAQVIIDWLSIIFNFACVDSIDDIENIKHEISQDIPVLVKRISDASMASNIRWRGGFIVHVRMNANDFSLTDDTVPVMGVDYLISHLPNALGFSKRLACMVHSMRERLNDAQRESKQSI